jgi:predicted RND superfamily exporter protein
MKKRTLDTLSVAYASWIDRHRRAILGASFAIAIGAAWLAAHLPVQADLSYLLPPSARSVQDLRSIEKRARVIGTVMVVVKSDDPEARATAAHKMRDRLRAMPPDLVSSVTFDESVARKYAWDHRWLFASLPDITAARDALRDEIADAKVRANPLFVDLGDPPPPRPGTTELRKKLRDAEAKQGDPGELVSDSGHAQLMIVRTGYSSGDVDRDERLLEELDNAFAQVRVEVPGVDIGAAGDVVLTVAEHDAILNGMLMAMALTVGLVLLALLLFFRSPIAIGALSWSLVVGALATFGFTKLAVGHLNLATAFLSSIVIGNGINFGILLLARYGEELRAGHDGVTALGNAIRGTLAGTFAAALTAAVAYASLIVTAFRGFRDFGIIAGVGILLCWISAYTVLPAALAVAARTRLLRPRKEPSIPGAFAPPTGKAGRVPPQLLSRALSRLAPRNPLANAVVMLALTLTAGGLTWHYLAGDPFESDFANLRSSNDTIKQESGWMRVVDKNWGQGISGGFVIAVKSRDQVAPLVSKLRAMDKDKPRMKKLFSRVNSLDDLMPADQPAKLALLAEIRGMLTPDALENLSDTDRADANALRPPANLTALHDADVPEDLAWPFIESDGSRGRLILAMEGWGYDNWSAKDIVRFADDARGLELGDGVLLGGSSFVFADMLDLMNHDGPVATLLSMIGAILVVILIVGWRRHGLVTVLCGLTGTLAMLALGSLVGLKVNFLDFVALPITIGIGIDYAVNIAARDRQDPSHDSARLLASVGAAVLLCSFTTIVGYGSLLLSANQGIRSFGTAAILGEATCLTVALLFAPALLRLFLRRSPE